MLKFLKQNNRGFTLIELLVVVAIIGVLSTIVLVSVNEARVKARDVRRVADLRQLALALEFYYDDNDAYIDSGGVCVIVNETSMNDLTPDYMGAVPDDPKVGQDYSYGAEGANEQDYVLRAVIEGTAPGGSYTTDVYGCSCDQTNDYCIRP